MLKLDPKASPSLGRSSHTTVFETTQIEKDFKALLGEFEISVTDYQRLEFLFRQTLMQSPATALEYSHFEELIDFKSQLPFQQLIEQIDESLEHWHLRYHGRKYGFGKIEVYESSAKTEARKAYRSALRNFNEIFARIPSRGMKESWLKQLADKLRFHVVAGDSKAQPLNGKNRDYLVAYLGFAEAIYRPFFVRHFQNRRLTSEKYFEFLALKLSVEAGEFIVPHPTTKLTSDSLELASFSDEPARMQMLPNGWLDYFNELKAAS